MNNRLITVLIMVCSTALWALPPVGASLPMTVHEDSETSTNVAFVAVQERMGSFGFSLSCTATASNNVQVAFGAANGEVGRGVGALREQFRIQVLPDLVAIFFR